MDFLQIITATLFGILANCARFTAAVEYCYDNYGSYVNTCYDDDYCCSDGYSCCEDTLTTGAIIGIVFGVLFLAIIIGVVLRFILLKKTKGQRNVSNTHTVTQVHAPPPAPGHQPPPQNMPPPPPYQPHNQPPPPPGPSMYPPPPPPQYPPPADPAYPPKY